MITDNVRISVTEQQVLMISVTEQQVLMITDNVVQE